MRKRLNFIVVFLLLISFALAFYACARNDKEENLLSSTDVSNVETQEETFVEETVSEESSGDSDNAPQKNTDKSNKNPAVSNVSEKDIEALYFKKMRELQNDSAQADWFQKDLKYIFIKFNGATIKSLLVSNGYTAILFHFDGSTVKKFFSFRDQDTMYLYNGGLYISVVHGAPTIVNVFRIYYENGFHDEDLTHVIEYFNTYIRYENGKEIKTDKKYCESFWKNIENKGKHVQYIHFKYQPTSTESESVSSTQSSTSKSFTSEITTGAWYFFSSQSRQIDEYIFSYDGTYTQNSYYYVVENDMPTILAQEKLSEGTYIVDGDRLHIFSTSDIHMNGGGYYYESSSDSIKTDPIWITEPGDSNGYYVQYQYLHYKNLLDNGELQKIFYNYDEYAYCSHIS